MESSIQFGKKNVEERLESRKNCNLDTFDSKQVKDIIYSMLRKHLKGKRYKNEDVELWCHQIACDIKDTLLKQGLLQYKLACEVVIGENRDSSLKVSSACFWDTDVDKLATEKYVTDYLVSMAVVFACRQYHK